MKNRAGLFASILIALCTQLLPQAQALTLGDLRGTAVLGQSLDVSVQVQAGPGEELSAACVKAEVFFADAPQMAPTVTVGAATGALSEVRIRSSAMVNEPVVMVQVHATCGSSHTRRYVLLADFPKALQSSEAQPLVAAPALAVNEPVSQPTSTKPTGAAKPSIATPDMNSAGTGDLAAKSPASSKNGSKVRDASPPKSRTRPTGKAVLKLDPLDIFSDRMDKLDSLMLFEPAEDALKQTKQITALQDDLKAMRDLVSKNDAQMASLRSQLEQAQTQQVPILLVYALTGLVVLCLIILGWLWSKQRQSHKMSDWWQQHEDEPATILMPPNPPEKAPETPEVTDKPVKTGGAKLTNTVAFPRPVMGSASAAKPAQTVPEVDLDIDLDSFMLSEKKSDSAPLAPLQPMPVRGIHHINAESILDIRQQAEFFMSLGQTDRAINLLKLQIEEADESNPMVYLDLISLYHSLGMKTDFRELRDAFQKEFNARMPDFPAFNVAGKELENYPEVLEKLASLWPQNQALSYLDTCIFHNPLAPVRPMFELNAFRDLLLLHALVEDINADLPSLGNLSAAFESPSPVSVPASLDPPAEMTLGASVMPPPLSEGPVQPAQNLVHDEAHSMDFSLEEDPVDALPNEPAEVSIEPESIPVDEPAEVVDALPEEAPTSMMLDLDFSSIAMPASGGLQSTDEAEPINHPPVRYATRSRAADTKKSK
ncbi:MAG: hypothetical protein FD135_2103 [Comamonadaceae bacterium]|nr:MAG: hypothetical protein FD135_2103 [Comamonadaceae bacterium]